MHIPDNYLSPSTCAVIGAVMVPAWAVAIKKVKNEVTKSRMPMLGIGAAFSFLLMMFNVPLPGGTTGHAVGGTLINHENNSGSSKNNTHSKKQAEKRIGRINNFIFCKNRKCNKCNSNQD